MNKLPIGVFDSGLGGLTAVSALKRLLPKEDIIYFGDNARIPYGTKSPEIIRKFALQDTRFLMSKGVKAILVACGTVSSNCLKEVAELANITVEGVIDGAVKKAGNIAKKGENRVAVLGTTATINSGAFEAALRGNGVTDIINCPCPMFVPLVENWHPHCEDTATNAVVAEYLSPVAERKPDCAILGCTHYPLLKDIIEKYLPESKLISSGEYAARELAERLDDLSLLNPDGGKTEFYTSGGASLFRENASRFLQSEITGTVEHIDIENY